MKNLIKWIAIAVLAGGTLYAASNYNVVVTPVAAQEGVCVTVDASIAKVKANIEQYEATTKQDVDWTSTTYDGVIADNFVANILKAGGYDETSITTAIDKIGSIVIFKADIVDTSLLVMFDNDGCMLGEVTVPTAVLDSFNAEANTI